MSTTLDITREELDALYSRIASDYCRSLPLEHFMESTDQSTQRKITIESLDLVSARWPEFQVFSELLILYPLTEADLKKPTRVCPDNMVIVHDEPINAKGSFNVPLQPAGPTLILEYVSAENKRKDYVDNRRRYANDLQVPYYLLFEPEAQKLTVFKLSGKKYVAVKPNADGRLEIPPLKLAVAIRDGWVRFWFEGELLPLPGEMLDRLDEVEAENERLKKEIARIKASRNGHS
jgi:Uma2 family endonuclease